MVWTEDYGLNQKVAEFYPRYGRSKFRIGKTFEDYQRVRYKRSKWRQSALKFIKTQSRRHGGFGKNYLANAVAKGFPHRYVGWSGKRAVGTKAQWKQDQWRYKYFKKHKSVI